MIGPGFAAAAIGQTLGPKLAIAGLIIAGLFIGWQLDRRAQFNAGIAQERAAAVERANEKIAEMEKDNAQISDMDHRAKCAEFGFDWLPDRGCY